MPQEKADFVVQNYLSLEFLCDDGGRSLYSHRAARFPSWEDAEKNKGLTDRVIIWWDDDDEP